MRQEFGDDNEHGVTRAQVLRNEVGDLRLTAMAVEQHELADAGADHAVADLGGGADHRLGRQRERAGEILMLVGFADRERGQHQHVEIGRDQLRGAAQKAGIDERIRP